MSTLRFCIAAIFVVLKKRLILAEILGKVSHFQPLYQKKSHFSPAKVQPLTAAYLRSAKKNYSIRTNLSFLSSITRL